MASPFVTPRPAILMPHTSSGRRRRGAACVSVPERSSEVDRGAAPNHHGRRTGLALVGGPFKFGALPGRQRVPDAQGEVARRRYESRAVRAERQEMDIVLVAVQFGNFLARGHV